MADNNAKHTRDGFQNLVKGLGSEKDPRQQVNYIQGIPMDLYTASSLYVYNWLANRVVDLPVDDSLAKWRTLLISDPDKKKKVEEVLDAHDIKGHIDKAMKWSRIYGGSVIIPILDEDQEEPLDLKTIRKGSLINIVTLDRYNVYPAHIERNVISPNYGKPQYYTVVRGGQRIHHSRCIRFDGKHPTIYELERNNFWGISIFTSLFEVISDSQIVSNSIASLIYETNVDVFRINGLNEMIANGQDELALKRFKIIQQMKSSINGIALDSLDEYDKKGNTFANLDTIDDRYIQKVAGASNIPVTKLLGISPAGMNATGISDMRNYYDGVQSLQENVIRPRLSYLDHIIAKSEGFDDFDFDFNPLEIPSEFERADLDQKNAQRDQIYHDMGIINSYDILNQLYENGTYASLDAQRIEDEKLVAESAEDMDEDEGFNGNEAEDNNTSQG